MNDRAPNDVLQEFAPIRYEHPGAIAATTLFKLETAQRHCRVDRFEICNPTGFAADPANYWVLELRKGATVMASWSTQTAAQGALTADTFMAAVLSATDANRVAVPGDVITLACVKFGSATNLPLGRIVAHCRYV